MTLRDIYNDLQTLDSRNPGAWPVYVQIGVITLSAIAVLIFLSYVLIQPEYEGLQAEQAKEQTLRTEFERKQRKAASLDAYKAQLDTMEHDFGAMLRQLPSKSEVENLLNDISQTRVAASLDEELFQPQVEVVKDFYAELPNRIVVTGTYHQMGAFVSGVAALPRIVTIDEVDLRPAGPGAKGALRMTALAKTYRYLDPSEIPPAAPGGPR